MGGGRRNVRHPREKSEEMNKKKGKSTKLSAAAVPFVPKVETRTHPAPEHATTGVFCTICSDEVAFLAVGTCNHPICSLCSLRLRFKNKNDDCAICKAKLSVVVVYDCRTRPGEVRFSDLGDPDTAEDIFDGPPMPGTQIDSSNRMVYLDCRDHFVSLTSFKRLVCPCVESNCSYEAASHSSLIQHLNSAHNGLTMCSLCLENRPLFLHEHELMTKKELQAHMAGQEKSADSSYFLHNSHANKFTTGHPKCEFCKVHVFDQLALYNHLQQRHFTCHLCDETMMFRYYQDLSCLRDHHRRHHFMCQLCDEDESMSNSDVCYSFRTSEEYRDHLRSYHALRDTSRYISPVGKVHYHHKGGQGKGQDARRMDHFDLDVGSANPFSQDNRIRNHSRSQRRQESNSQQKSTSLPASTSATNLTDFPALGSAISDDFVSSIPPNMRVVGKISGTGRMTAPDESDLALQAMADAAHRQATIRNRMFSAAAVPTAASFPTLTETINTGSPVVPSGPAGQKDGAIAAIDSGDSNAKRAAHPLSLVNRIKSNSSTSSLQGKTNEPTLEDKRVARNVVMAEALGIASKQQSNLTSEVVGGTISNQAYRQAIIESLSCFRLPNSVLFAPLYPPEMISWAKKSHTELCKVERRLHLFLQDPKATSLPLKPMKSTDRLMMHCLGKYYRLYSYEYDPEPYRYVSLSKTVQSCAPDVLLSDACLSTMFSPSSLNPSKPSATIYLQLADGLVQTWGRSSDRKQHSYLKPYSFNSSMVIFGEVILQLQELLLQYQQQMDSQEQHEYEDFSLVNISAVGPTALSIRFRDIPTAQMVERLLHNLQSRASENAQLVQNSTSVAMTIASPQIQIGIFPYFKMFPDFPVLLPPTPPPELANDGGAVEVMSEEDDGEPVDAVVDCWSDGNDTPDVPQFRLPRAVVDEDEEEYEIIEAVADSSMTLAFNPADDPSLASAAADDWEAVADQDDYWAEFLAEKRRKASEGGTTSGGKYRPPVTNESARPKWDDVPVVPVPEAAAYPEVPDTSDDFALALALQQQEESGALLHMNHEAFPDLSMDDMLAMEVGVTSVGSSTSERGPWKRIGKPTAVAPEDSPVGAVAAQVYVPPHQRSQNTNSQYVREVLPSTTAFVVPTAMALSEDPALRLLSTDSSGLAAMMASTGSSKSTAKKPGNKFTALMDDDEDD